MIRNTHQRSEHNIGLNSDSESNESASSRSEKFAEQEEYEYSSDNESVAEENEAFWTRESIFSSRGVSITMEPSKSFLPKGCLSKFMTPVDYLFLIVDDKFFEAVCEQTNKYMERKAADREIMANLLKRQGKRSHQVTWRRLTITELKIFLGLFYWMGLVRLPDIKDHWSKASIFRNSDFSKNMPRDRFLQILQNLRFCTSDDAELELPRNKLAILIDAVLYNSKKLYRYSALSLDESMVSFRGRHKSKVYMPHKPIRIGFKAYVL